jgi:hypothetical protein
MVAIAAPSFLQSALLQANFTVTNRAPMILQENHSIFSFTDPPAVNMMDSDAAYLLD